MSIGIDVIVGKAITPLLVELAKGATGATKTALKNWFDGNYTSKLAEKLAVTDRVKTLWSPDEETSLLKIYFPSTISSPYRQRQIVDSLAVLPPGNIVIEGIVGHGKSIFLRYLCLQELAGKGVGTLPLFLELRTLNKQKGLQDKISEALDKLDINSSPDVFEYLAKSGKLTLLLDGFDELEESLTLETISYLEYLMEKYPSLRIIVTSRPSNEIQKSRHMKVVTLCGLRKSDHAGFLRRLGLDGLKIHDIIDAIARSPENVSSLITTPLMLTLLVLVYESEREIPSQLSEFFERLFSTMFTRHDRLKAGFNRKHYSGLSESRLQKLFETFCFLALRNRHGRTLNSEQFTTNFEKACEVTKEIGCVESNFKDDIVKVSCLMLEEGFDSINFLHKSIPEFFSAAFIKRAPEDTAKKFYEKAIVQGDMWDATLSFLRSIDSYRYEKFYNLVRHKELLKSLGTDVNVVATFNSWKVFFNEFAPEFCVGFGHLYEDRSSDELDAKSWGPYKMDVLWGSDIHQRLMARFVSGLQKDLPKSISRTIARGEPKKYTPVDSSEEGVEFEISLKKLFDEFDFLESYRELQIFERSVWVEIEQSLLIIKNEDSKSKLIDDDIF